MTRARAVSWLGLLAGLACALAVACGGRGGAATLAELVEITGQAEASAAAAPAAWSAAATGHRFARGDGVRTGDASGARVKLRSGGVLRMGAHALVRFGPDAGGGQPAELALEAGEAEIEAGGVELVIDTGGGRTRVRAGAKAHLTPMASGGMRVDIEIGTATVEQAGQPALTLAAGEGADVAPAATLTAGGGASRDAGPPAAPPDGGPPAVAVDVPGGSISVDTPATIVDVDVSAGEQATVHDASPPTQVRLAFPGVCPGEAIVELRSGRTRARLRGAGQVVAPLGPGQHRYLIHCLTGDKPAARVALRGTLRVLADRGEKRIKLTAPKNQVDADGRNWQLLYQNKKPQILFRWPKPPAADGYTLVIADAHGRERKRAAAGGKATLDSGEVGEGAWRFWFVAAAGGERSPVTQLTLAFDNAAPVAQLIEPAAGDAWKGVEVRVAGVATDGSSVSVDGVDLPLDGSLRFDSRVTLAAGRNAVAVRIAQPGRGVHYYVRRRPR